MKRRVKRHAVVQPLDQSYRLIPLTQGQNAIVDAEDFEWLSQWNWNAQWDYHTNSFYAVRRYKGEIIRMHRAILNCTPRKMGDHENHNTLDNRRKNLRKATRTQNRYNTGMRASNTSGYRGVHWNKSTNGWIARLGVHGKKHYLGQFKSPKEAAHAYDKEAQQIYGEFAHLNFPLLH